MLPEELAYIQRGYGGDVCSFNESLATVRSVYQLMRRAGIRILFFCGKLDLNP